MIVVPEKTIVCMPVIPDDGYHQFDMDFSIFLKPLNKNHKRDWFTPHFYKCLPLSIGNMQGFSFSVPFDFSVIWNGGDLTSDLVFFEEANNNLPKNMNHVSVRSEFGHGIFTIHFPLILKTPPGVNLMTISPPNYPVPGITPMTGVVETDNLRFGFTLNFKIDFPNTKIRIVKDYPIMGILPIPRYFCDSFELVNAYDILDRKLIEEEQQVVKEHSEKRNKQILNNELTDGLYFKGMDVRGNKFDDHQLPRGMKK